MEWQQETGKYELEATWTSKSLLFIKRVAIANQGSSPSSLSYLRPMHLHRLLGYIGQLVSVQLCRPGIVFLLSIRCVAVVLPEELGCVRIATQLHAPQLNPGPIGV